MCWIKQFLFLFDIYGIMLFYLILKDFRIDMFHPDPDQD